MATVPETAAHPEGLRRVVIDPVTRVEGHGKVTLLLDAENRVQQARLHIVEFRGFERFIQGRPYWEIPVLVQRLCGICPVSHHLAAAKAIDQLVGVDTLTPTAEKLRRLLHLGQTLQSHALHFFHLASPDLLFGFGSDARRRNIVGVAAADPNLALKGIGLRKYGQEVIRHISGKRVHGTAALPGGMNKALAPEDRDTLLKDIETIIADSRIALQVARDLYLQDLDTSHSFAAISSSFLSLSGPGGALDLYHGGLRARSASGEVLLEDVDYRTYFDHLREEVRSWSYMKFPYLQHLGVEKGWYRVGPLARINNADVITTPLAEAARVEFMKEGKGLAVQPTLAYHWARMIEVLHAAEGIQILLEDPEILGHDLMASGERRSRGIGVIEAPRGTLFHDYSIDENDLVTKANLIVSTTSNNQAMNESIRQVAATYLDGVEPTEGLLNHLEVAIRAYDPCLSCATHALGKMPLEVEVIDVRGQTVGHAQKGI
jgi:NAD-reducing hydrogenase large subunit